MRVHFEGFNAADQKKIMTLHKKCANILPPWLRDLYFRYDFHLNNNGAVADIHAQTEYRIAVITLHYNFWDKTNDPLLALAHEYFHIIIDPLVETALNAVESMGTEDMKKFMSQQLTYQLESAVQDLTNQWLEHWKK